MSDFRDLAAYKLGYDLSMRIFQITSHFPREEKYSLTDQIRRSSRSVCANIAEAYRKRNYKNYFISKLIEADGENSETLVWLEFSKDLKYITNEQYTEMLSLQSQIGKLVQFMLANPEKFGAK